MTATPKKLRIILISPTEYKSNQWGGVMTYTLLHAQFLHRLGHQVLILSPGTRTSVSEEPFATIVKVATRQITWTGERVMRALYPLCTERIKWMIAVTNYIRVHAPNDVVEAPEWGSATTALSLMGHKHTVVRLHRSLLQYHQDNHISVNADLMLVNLLEMLAVISANILTAPTRFILTTHPWIISVRNLFRRPTYVIPNGVPIPTIRPPITPKPPYILCVGRLERAKGQLVLIRAFAKIHKSHPHVQLVCIGRDPRADGGYKRLLIDEIRTLGIEKRVIIPGPKPQTQLETDYQNCLFYVAPSIGSENHPISVLDAIRWGKAVIASRTGGLPEIIDHNVNGLLVQQNSPDDLAEQLDVLLSRPQVRKRLETYNLVHRHQYDLQNIIRRFASVYTEAQSAHRQTTR